MVSYLKPFNWTNPIIFCLPDSKKLLVTSPVPILAGILKSKAAFDWDLWPHIKDNDNQVVVFLDDDDPPVDEGEKKRKKSSEKTSKVRVSVNLKREFILPYFDEKRNELEDHYQDYHVMAKVFKSKVDMAFDKHLEIGFSLAVIIRKIFEDRILSRLPLEPKPTQTHSNRQQQDRSPAIDLDYLRQRLMQMNPLDDLFFYHLCSTQAFSHYAHKHYSKKQ